LTSDSFPGVAESRSVLADNAVLDGLVFLSYQPVREGIAT
jgi:hypothetical protein